MLDQGQGSSLTLDLEGTLEIDHVIIQEDISKGKRVLKYTLETLADGKWRPVAEGTAIGHKDPQVPPVSRRKDSADGREVAEHSKCQALRDPATGQTIRNKRPRRQPPKHAAETVGENRVNLTWAASQDPETGVAKYLVLRNGTVIGEAGTTSYSDSELFGSTNYSYQVVAVNGGMESRKSNTVSLATPVEVTGPAVVSVRRRPR